MPAVQNESRRISYLSIRTKAELMSRMVANTLDGEECTHADLRILLHELRNVIFASFEYIGP
jgi:hypothetical protein